MALLDGLEKSLEGVFVKSAPKLPERGKEVLVAWLPWINLVLGILTLWAVYWLWQWAHAVNNLVDFTNQFSQVYGGPTITGRELTAMVWVGLVVLGVEAVLFLMAFQATRTRSKRGWNLMFYALLVNLVYGILVIFTDYGGVGSFIGYLIGTIIGLWLLFQIRSKYLGHRSAPAEPQA
ncbi:MAG: hypothetical protein WEC17_00600 [Candidatus Saccharimonadales bacterium]